MSFLSGHPDSLALLVLSAVPSSFVVAWPLTAVQLNSWRITGGKFQYIAWGSQSSDPDSFYTDDNVKQLYKNSIQGLVTHVNSLTGVAYMDDPTIFAWGMHTCARRGKLCKSYSCHIAWRESCCAADLMNEMRSACDTGHPNVSCTATATQYMQAWVEEIAAYVKTVDPNHMLTVGEEGFYAVSPCLPF